VSDVFRLRSVLIGACVGLLFGLSSCTLLNNQRSTEFYLAHPEALFFKAVEQMQKVQSFRGEGYLTFESPEGGFTGLTTVLYRSPDSLRVTLRTNFGVPIGELLVLGENVWLYNLREKVLYRSRGKEVPLEGLIGMRLSVGDVFTAATGRPLLEGLADLAPTWWDSMQVEPVDGLLRYRFRFGENVRTYVADPAKEQFVAFSSSWPGYGAFYCQIGRFRKVRGVRLPQHIQVIRPDRRERLAVYFRRLEANPRPRQGDFSLKIRDDVDVVWLKS